ncbi:MAG: YfhO family protein, partial [Candidatus Sericytochromatia bacterium]
NMTVLLAYLVAGAGAYAFGRAIAMPRPAALLTGLVFMLSGFLLGHLEHVVVVQAAGLAPWLLFAIERARSSGNPRYFQLGAVITALMILAGHPQTAAFSLLVAAAYGLCRLAGPAWRRDALGLAMTAAIGIGLALMQLLPTWDLARLSDRSALGYQSLIEMSLPPRQLLTLIFPFLFGGAPSTLFPTPYWGAGAWPNELVGYVGLPSLLLAACALPGLKRPPVAFFAALALVGAVLALGGFTPLYQLWAELPLLNTMRVPGRHLFEVDLAIAVLAGLGLTRLLAMAPADRDRAAMRAWGLLALAAGGLVLALAAVGPGLAARWQAFAPSGLELAAALAPTAAAVWVPLAIAAATGAALLAFRGRGARFWAMAILVVTAADLGLFAWHVGWRQQAPASAPVGEPGRFEPYRTASVAADAYPYRDPALVAALRYPVTSALAGVRSVGGYDPLMPARFARIMDGVAHGGHLALPVIWGPAHHAIDLFGARRVVIETPLLEGGWADRLASGRFTEVTSEGPVTVFENQRAMPMAWRPAVAEVHDPARVDALITREPDFDPRTTVLLEAPLAIEQVVPGTASVERHSLNRLTVATQGSGPGVVVVSEGYDPGWRASTGGRQLAVHRANGLLLGIEVPEGAHHIALVYEPPFWRAGLLGSGLSLLALLYWWRRSRATA